MSAPHITLYWAPQTRAGRILWQLEELGVPYEKVALDLSKGAQKDPKYLAINPNGKVPAVVVDGTPMFESLAILLYFAERFGVEKGLWPRVDAPNRPTAMSWLVWETATLSFDAMRMMYASSERFPKEWHNEAAAKAARGDVDRDLALLEEQLAKSKYVAGDAFTFADFVAMAVTFFGRMGVDLSKYPSIERWSKEILARPALQRAMAMQR